MTVYLFSLVYASTYNLTHPLLAEFQTTFEHLTFMPIDAATGSLEVYRGIPFTIPHRHYSHLFSVWPLHIGDLPDPAWYSVAQRSIDTWLNDPASDSEFFRPVASKMSTLLSRPGAAYGNISILINNLLFVQSNTFYKESGGPCTETPYAAAWAISELLLQSWNTSLDIFPAVPDVMVKYSGGDGSGLVGLADASFFRVRAMGGFVVSATRAVLVNNATHIISTPAMLAVERTRRMRRADKHADNGERDAEAAAPVEVVTIWTTMQRPLVALNCDAPGQRLPLEETGGGYVRVALPPPTATGTPCVAVLPGDAPVPVTFDVTPSQGNASFLNYWGFPDRRI